MELNGSLPLASALDAHLCDAFELGGPGPSVAVKDVIDVAGHPTRAGSRAFASASPASSHAPVVQALLDAGCRVVGKLRMHELAFGVTGVNAWSGTPPNPLFPDLVPGGSSSGSATVVAAGLVDFSLGTDTGGSIRVPAACCGVVGLKPTFGRLSRSGLTPAESSLDCVGPLARDVATVVRAMEMLDARFQSRTAPDAVRAGWVACEADPSVSRAVRAALGFGGIEVEAVDLPNLGAAHEAGLTIMNAEMARIFGHLVDAGLLGRDVEGRLRASLSITREAVEGAERVRVRFTQEVDAALAGVDVLALPTLPAPPLRLTEADDAAAARASTRLVRPFNLSGHPAISLPLPGREGFPLGLQLVAPLGGDEALCAVAERIEALWHRAPRKH